MGKKEFITIVLDPEHETFIVYIMFFSATSLNSIWCDANIYLFFRFWIASLITEEASTKVFAKYNNFIDVFSLDLTSKLPKYIKINYHAIEPVNNQQPPYKPIYSLKSIELKTLKAYIKTNLAN